MKLRPLVLTIIFTSFFIHSCKKADIVKHPDAAASLTANKTLNSISYSFSWENAERMPVPPGTETILSPWAAGANSGSFPPSFINDRYKADGWELIYNTFNTTELINPRFFILYNKYKSLLRAFFYLPSGTPIPSQNITHTIKFKNASLSTALNYASNEIVSFLTPQTEAMQVQPYRTGATGTWFAGEFEINYDPSTNTYQANNSLLEWDLNSININDVFLSGQSQGSVTGTMIQKGSPSNSIFQTAIKGGVQYVAANEISKHACS